MGSATACYSLSYAIHKRHKKVAPKHRRPRARFPWRIDHNLHLARQTFDQRVRSLKARCHQGPATEAKVS